jgi:hypothetical protein
MHKVGMHKVGAAEGRQVKGLECIRWAGVLLCETTAPGPPFILFNQARHPTKQHSASELHS